jgi:hypothetical protein
MGTLAHKKILHSPVFIKIAGSIFWWVHTTSKWVDQAQTSSLKTAAQYFLSAQIQLQAKSNTRRNFNESPVHHEPSVGSRNSFSQNRTLKTQLKDQLTQGLGQADL